LGRIAAGMQRAQDDANQSRVDDALNQLRETELDLTYGKDEGYTYLKGVQALQRPDGKPLSDEYLEKIKTRANDIESSLSNDKQKAAFRVRSNERLTQFRGNLMNYEGQENRNYEVSVAQGTIASAQREVAAFYNDPNRINEAIGSIQAAAVKDGRLRGLSAEQIDVN
jgi:soluble lytic murein transglycosylase